MSKQIQADAYQRSEIRDGRLTNTHTGGRMTTDTRARTSTSLLIFFVLVFVLSVPLWVLGATNLVALPKDTPLYFPNLLWHISMAIIPMIVALILVYRERGSDGVKHLLKRPFDYIRIKRKIWYVPIFFLFPILMVLEYGLMKFMGVALPDLQFPGLMVPIFFVVFFAAGIGEELGWLGYAFDPLQDRWTALGASIILGIVWAVLHLVPIMQEPHTTMWIVWHLGTMVPLRVISVWIYNNTGRSMFAVIAFHAMANIGEVVWPFYGTSGYYKPMVLVDSAGASPCAKQNRPLPCACTQHINRRTVCRRTRLSSACFAW